MMVEWADQSVSLSILGGSNGRLGLDNGIDTTNCGQFKLINAKEAANIRNLHTAMCDFSCNLEENVVFDLATFAIALFTGHGGQVELPAR